jgi:hypothetical protein
MSPQPLMSGRRLDAPASANSSVSNVSVEAMEQGRVIVPGWYVACCVVVTTAWSIRVWLVIPAALGCLLAFGVNRGLTWAERAVSAWADRLFAAQDAAARAEGWQVICRPWGCRTYRDPRIRATAEARALGQAWWSDSRDESDALVLSRSGWSR